MERKPLKPVPGKSSDKKRSVFLEGLIARYFDKQSENDDADQTEGQAFDKNKVYNKVLSGIREKENNSCRRIYVLRVAASILLVFSLSFVLYMKKNEIGNWLNPVRLVEARAAKGQTVLVKLEDGSRVWLNSDSRLTYPERFEGEKREIHLTGEAYFEVVHLAKKPFIIESGEVKTVVLGTSFNIKAYPHNRKVEVTVLTGKVAVITPDSKKETANTVYVTPDLKATYARDHVGIQTTSVKAKESIGWKEGKMLFNNTPLGQAIEEIERKYNVKLSCSDRIRECTITTTADLNDEGLGKVLKVMATTVNGSVSYQKGTYYLDGKGCE